MNPHQFSIMPTEQNHIQLWEKCLAIFRDNLNESQFESWFKPVTSVSYENSELYIQIPSPYFKEYLEEKYIKLIAFALHKVYGPGVKLFYKYNQVQDDPTTRVTMESANPSPAVKRTASVSVGTQESRGEANEIDSQLNPYYTFENFCSGPSNELARTIGQAIADDPRCKTFNPFFVFGAPGVGKTHLIQAIGIRIKEKDPRKRVLYVTARLFESQYTAAMLGKRINDFINFYQSIDVLIIDDIQDLKGKPGTQNTFFHIFNHLKMNQKQLILSSDTRPSELEGMDTRMLDRFKWGMTAEMEKPDFELRREVLLLKARKDGIELADEVVDYIAGNVKDSVRELEGIMVSMMAHATILNKEITVDLAKVVLGNAVKINRRQINFEIIAEKVSAYFNITPDQLFTKSRKREISDARQLVMFMAKKHAKMGLKAIGNKLDRTHATVLYACRNIEERIPIDKQLKEDVAKIESAILA